VCGYPAASRSDAERALKNARETGRATTLMYALFKAGHHHLCCRNYAAANLQVDELIAFADAKGTQYFKALGTAGRGWLFALTGKASDAVRAITSGITSLRSTGASLYEPQHLQYLAMAYAKLAWRCIDDAIETMERSKGRWGEAEVASHCRRNRTQIAEEVKTGRVIRLWRDELLALREAPFNVGPDNLFVAFFASAEFGCFLELGWPLPDNVLDLYAEHRVATNGEKTPCGDGLLGALALRGLAHINAGEKEDMRRLILDRQCWSEDEKPRILDYCASDVTGTTSLFSKMAPSIDWPRALLRGRYMKAVGRMERTGVPIDTSLHREMVTNWGEGGSEMTYDGLNRRLSRFHHVEDGLIHAPLLIEHGVNSERFAEINQRYETRRVEAAQMLKNRDWEGYVLAAKYRIEDIEFEPAIRDLFDELRTQILALGDDVIQLPGPNTVSYRVLDFFVEVIPRKKRLALVLNLDFDEADDPSQRAIDATERAFIIHATETGGVLFRVAQAEHIGPAMHLVRQAYEKVSE
jgi:predicted transport protein